MLRPALLATLCTLAACAASSPPAPTTPDEPLAAPTPPSAVILAPAEGVTALALACTQAEVDNGADDDCDGHIDEGSGAPVGTLELALTWTGPTPLSLRTEPAVAEAPASDCHAQRPCTLRLVSDTWQRQPLTLWVTREATAGEAEASDAAPEPLTASLCAAAHGTSLGCHNFTLTPGQAREVARLTAR